jgi:hypothetical protein
LSACAPASAVEPAGESFGLPAAPRAAVIELVFEDRAASREAPFLRIDADGAVHVPDPSERAQPRFSGRLSQPELQQLLRELLVTHDIANLHTGDLERALATHAKQAGLDWRIPGADATLLRITLADRVHEVRCGAVSLLCERFPRLAPLQKLGAAQRRLENVAAVAQVGGTSAARRLAALATRELESRTPDSPQVTALDLSYVRTSRDGLRYVQFEVRGGRDRSQRVTVSVVEAPGEPPRVSVLAAPNSTP